MDTQYSYNPADKQIPNPYRFENASLLFAAFLVLVGGFAVLVEARTLLIADRELLAIVVVFLAVGMFGAAITMAVRALSQLRIIFGRNQPSNLAGLNDESSKDLLDSIRSQSIRFSEPAGPLTGMIFSIVRPLATCPPPVQHMAVKAFHSLFGMTAILGSMIMSFVLFHGTPHEGVVSWLYLPLCGLSLISPFIHAAGSGLMFNEESTSAGMLAKLIGLGAFSLAAPILLGKYMPAYAIAPMWVAPLVLLVGSMIAMVLQLLSLVSRPDHVLSTEVAIEQGALDMNCHPAQLWTKVKRDFQSQWTNGIPNREYAHVTPAVGSAERGHFEGVIAEETQPLLKEAVGFSSLKQAWTARHTRYLILLDSFAVLLAAASVWYAIRTVPMFPEMIKSEISRTILTVFGMNIASIFAFRLGHLPWSRMTFVSRLTWLVVDGTYQSAKMAFGNKFRGHIHSESTLTRVEGATLRIWMADMITIAYGKSAKRYVMGLLPVHGLARQMAEDLRTYALDQTTLTTPTSDRDLEKLKVMGKVEAIADKYITDAKKALKDPAITNGQLSLTDAPDARMIGTVKFFNEAKGFGFVQLADGRDLFFAKSDLVSEFTLPKGLKVSFLIGTGKKGPKATRIALEL